MQGEHINYTISFGADITSAKAGIDALQGYINKLGLSPKLGDKINQEFAKFGKAYDTYMSKINSGPKNKADYNAISKSLNDMKTAMAGAAKEAEKISAMDPLKAFRGDKDINALLQKIDTLQNKIKNFKFDSGQFKGIFSQISANISPKNTGIKSIMDQINSANKAGNYEGTINGLNRLQNAVAASQRQLEGLSQQYDKDSPKSQAYAERARQLGEALEKLKNINPSNLSSMQGELDKLMADLQKLGQVKVGNWVDATGQINRYKSVVEQTADSLHRINKEEFGMQRQVEMVDRQIQSYFGLSQMLRKVMNIARQAFRTVQELDKSMTETAVVTNFDVSDMWEKLPQYTQVANELGVAINDVYKATTLYYQQGLNTNQAMGIATQTLKMARIGGLEAAEATDMMTAALRGFNMQINEMSAQHINDVYSELAATSASNTRELGEAMTRTASIANSAGMAFETTSAFLAQMIETTREAPENLGTAMKTIIARFQELKKAPSELKDEEGELLDYNRVDKALKSVGITLVNTNGEFKRTDQVLLELSSQWDSLSQSQQRYIATQAAGSRQQSRFIAMVGNYERTMELVKNAQNATGASQEQYEKTLQSLATKIARLKNAWNQFAMGLMNDKIIKTGVDLLTGFLSTINKIINALSAVTGPFKGITKSILTLISTLAMLSVARKGLSAGLMAGYDWMAGKKTMGSMFSDTAGAVQGANANGAAFIKGVTQYLNKNQGDISGAIKHQFERSSLDLLRNRQNYTLAPMNANDMVPTVRDMYSGISNGNIQATEDNLALIQGGLIQSLSQTDKWKELGTETAMKSINAFMTSFRQGTQAATKEDFRKIVTPALGKLMTDFGGRNVAHAFNNPAMAIANKQLAGLTAGAGQASGAIMQLGFALQATPLAPFGTALLLVSRLINGVVMGFGGLKTAIISTAAGLQMHAAMATADGTAIMLNGVALKDEEGHLISEATWQAYSNVQKQQAIAANLGFAASLKIVGGALLNVIKAYWPLIAAATVAYGLFKAFNYESDKLKDLKDRASAASDGFKSIRQEVSELEGNLESLEEFDAAFEELTSGTAEFNDKLLESNELVNKLIKQYPELVDKGYVSTDENGRLQISRTGREEIKEQQNARLRKAQAVDIFATARLKKEKSLYGTAEAKEINQAYSSFHTGAGGSKRATWGMGDRQAEVDKQLADLREAAEVKNAASNKIAVSSILSGKIDLKYNEQVANAIGEGFDKIKVNTDTSEEKRAETYAKLYGYEYISGNNFRDKEGNTVTVDKKVWNDEAVNKDIKVANAIDKYATTIDSAMGKMNGKIKDVFADSSSTLIGDILGGSLDVNADEIKKVINDDNALDSVVESLSEKEKNAFKKMGVTDIKQTIKDRGNDILTSQNKVNEQLATMLAKAGAQDGALLTNSGNSYEHTKGFIGAAASQLTGLSEKVKNLLVTTGQGLSENFGDNIMGNFINTFLNGEDKVRDELSNIVEGVDWSDAISSLSAINEMTSSTTQSIRDMGEAILDSQNGSHLLNDALQSVYASDGFDKILEDLDNFVNASGELDATGIEAMAEQSETLSDLLDSGAMTAGGLATAINAVSVDGVVDITDLSDSVLQLINYFGQLQEATYRAHKYIEDFDAGIDFGEADDFMTDNVEKIKEFAKNKEWGNEQFHNYISGVVGKNRFEEVLNSKGVNGNFQKAYAKLKDQIDSFAKGYDQMWYNYSQGKDSTGKKIDFNKLTKDNPELKNIKFETNGKGELELKMKKGTGLEELNQYFQKTQHVDKEQADLMIEAWRNLSPTADRQIREAQFYSGLKNTSFIEDHTVEGTDKVFLLESELNTLSDITKESPEKIGKIIGEYTDKKVQKGAFRNVDEKTGQLRTDYAQMAQDWNRFIDVGSKGSFIFQDKFADKSGGFDVNKIISGYTQSGFGLNQAQGMAFEQMKANGQESYTYNGQKIDLSEINTVDDFVEKLAQIDQDEQWTNIGHAIAEGYLDIIRAQQETEDRNSREIDYSDIGSNEGEQSRINNYKGDISAAINNEDLLQGSQQLTGLIEKLELGGKATSALIDDFVRLNASDLSKLSDEELQQVWTNLGYGEEEIDSIRAKINGQPFVFETQLTGADLRAYVKTINATPEEKTLLLNTEISNEEKVQQYLELIAEEFGDGDTKKKEIILEATAKYASGDEHGARQLLADNGYSPDEIQHVEQKLEVAFNGSIANKDELQTALTNAVDSVVEGTELAASKGDIKKKVVITTYYKEGGKKGQQPKNQTATVSYKKGQQAAASASKAEVNYYKISNQVEPKTGKAKVWYNDIYDQIEPKTKHAKVIYDDDGKYTGQNNKISYHHVPQAGSLASGTKKGKTGPRGNGGLTLTGELGYEVAWLPDEQRSMVLGANGPQFVNLPKNAVIYNHEQSEEIFKRKSIPAGSMSGGDWTSSSINLRDLLGRGNVTVRRAYNSRPSGKGASAKEKKRAANSNKKITTEWKLKKEIGSTNVLIYNTEKKIEQTQFKIEKLQNQINKQLEKTSVTIKSITKNANQEVKQLQLSYALNTKLANLYDKRLQKADKNKKEKTDIKWSDTYQRKVKQKGKKTKVETKTKTKKAKINLSKYIDFDSATGAYQLNQKALNKVFKKNKNKGKAIRTAAEKAINENTSKRNSAAKAAEEAKNKLEELGKKLYDTFLGWENELTKIWNITQKIQELEKRRTKLEDAGSLYENMLKSGLATATTSFMAQSKAAYSAVLKTTAQTIELTSDKINEQQKKLSEAVSSADEKTLYKNLKANQDRIAAYNEQQEKVEQAEAKVEKDQAAIDKKKANDKKIKELNKLKKKGLTKKKIEKSIDKLEEKIKKTSDKKEKKKLKKQLAAKKAQLKTYNAGLQANKNKKAINKAADNASKNIGTDKTTLKSAKELLADMEQDLKDRKLFTETQQLLNASALEEAKKQYDIATTAAKYMTVTRYADGTMDINFDSEALEKDKQNGLIGAELAKGVQDYVKKAIDLNQELEDFYSEELTIFNDIAEKVNDLRDQYVDYANELLEAVEENTKEQIDKLTKLNDSISNALKDLLDEVKKRLDERRQKEDNAKTESDISKKQQRLATLRADTAGGHASEIKQLEQEIAEAQQNYGRTLEDQILQKLQNQADEAAKQRDRMIKLLNAQVELSGNENSNIALVEKYLANPQEYEEEIKELWRNNKKYYEKLSVEQEQLDGEWEVFWQGINNLPGQIAMATVTFNDMRDYLSNIEALLKLVQNQISGSELAQQLVSEGKTLKDLREIGISFPDAIAALEETNSEEEIVNQLKSFGMTAEQMYNNGISAKYARAAATNGNDWYNLAKAGYSYSQLTEAGANKGDLAKVAEQETKNNKELSAGKKYQKETGSSAKATQEAITAGNLDQSQMAGVQVGKVDVNGKKKNGVTKDSHISADGNYVSANIGSDLWFAKWDKNKGQVTGKWTKKPIKSLTTDLYDKYPIDAKQALTYAIKHTIKGGFINKNFKSLINKAGLNGQAVPIKLDKKKTTNATISKNGKIYWGSGKNGVYWWDPSRKGTTKNPNVKLIKATAANLKKWKSKDFDEDWAREAHQVLKKRGMKYASGGMNYTTGPAWLDGTRAKPEAVLNATDTKNFIALKDILSEVMGHITGSNTTTYGDSTYEININVDHLSNDYDVDKVAKRVEKIITEDASYRNVTMVRKFR